MVKLDYKRHISFEVYENSKLIVLPPFQISRCFAFSRNVAFATHLDIHYVRIYSKISCWCWHRT